MEHNSHTSSNLYICDANSTIGVHAGLNKPLFISLWFQFKTVFPYSFNSLLIIFYLLIYEKVIEASTKEGLFPLETKILLSSSTSVPPNTCAYEQQEWDQTE